MVARDDLPDGGACRMAEIIHAVKSMTKCTVEVLTSDFQGNQASLQLIAQAAPSIFNHNLETVARLSKRIRHTASYERSLACLSWMKQHSTAWIKSGLMLGLGEEESEVHSTLQDLKQAGCDIVTMGQYLRPSHHQCVVKEFITPQQFEAYAHYGKSIGIEHVYAAPFVRSSYNAAAVFDLLQHQK